MRPAAAVLAAALSALALSACGGQDEPSAAHHGASRHGKGHHVMPAGDEYLMYSHIGRDGWDLVAVAYVVDQAAWPDPPTDLRGAAYHAHTWTCVVDGEELDEDDVGPVSRDECRAQDGEWSPGGVWMTHVWLIDNPSGMFAETNPALV